MTNFRHPCLPFPSPSRPLKAIQSLDLARSIVRRHRHLQRLAAVTEIFCRQLGALLANQQGGGVCVAAYVVGTLEVCVSMILIAKH